jgi:hypothetical protein
MVTIADFPLELVARVFEELDLENAWSARQVCRHWLSVFEFCAYGSKSIYLRGICVGVDIICGILSAKGKVLDRHVIHGELNLESSKREGAVAQWNATEGRYEVWPGGRWRQYSIGDVLTDVVLLFKNTPSNSSGTTVHLGRDVTLSGHTTETDNIKKPTEVFDDFVLSIDTLEEPSPTGRAYEKHSVRSLLTPMWKVYAFLVHNTIKHRDEMELFCRHYAHSLLFRRETELKEIDGSDAWRGFGGYYSEIENYLKPIEWCY